MNGARRVFLREKGQWSACSTGFPHVFNDIRQRHNSCFGKPGRGGNADD